MDSKFVNNTSKLCQNESPIVCKTSITKFSSVEQCYWYIVFCLKSRSLFYRDQYEKLI